MTDDSSISPIYPRKLKIVSTLSDSKNVSKDHKRKVSAMRNAVRAAAREGLAAMKELYDVKEPGLMKKGFYSLIANENFFNAKNFTTFLSELKHFSI